MSWKTFAAAAGTLAMLMGSAHALTITNDDDVDYEFDLVIGQGDADMQMIELPAGSSLSDFCELGCTIKLPNGVEQSFEGDEIVTIKDGTFLIAE